MDESRGHVPCGCMLNLESLLAANLHIPCKTSLASLFPPVQMSLCAKLQLHIYYTDMRVVSVFSSILKLPSYHLVILDWGAGKCVSLSTRSPRHEKDLKGKHPPAYPRSYVYQFFVCRSDIICFFMLYCVQIVCKLFVHCVHRRVAALLQRATRDNTQRVLYGAVYHILSFPLHALYGFV